MTQTESTTRHTPGPWKAQCDCRSYRNRGIFSGDDPDPYGNRNAWGIYGPCRRIARLEEADRQHHQAQVDADARLIAAAPDLLVTLKRLGEAASVVVAADPARSGMYALQVAINEAYNAMVKAEGE